MAAEYGYSPETTDALTFRDATIMMAAGHERQKRRWRHTAEVLAMIYNMGGPRGESFRPKQANELVPSAFDDPVVDNENLHRRFEKYRQQRAHRLAQRDGE